MRSEGGIEGQEIPNGITRFSPEARKAIEESSWPILTLTGRSIRDLRQSDIRIVPEWPDQNYLETLPSRKSEVAIQWRSLENSFNKPMSQQQKLVERYSARLSEKIPDAEAIIGEAPDYLELGSLYIQRFGVPLFEYKTTLIPAFPNFLSRLRYKTHMYTRTATPVNSPRGSFVAVVSYFNEAHRLDGWPKEQDLHICGVTPLIVPRQG